MTKEQLIKLIAEYNEVEGAQVERLKNIFTAFHERKGCPRVKVGLNNVWGTNQFNTPVRIGLITMLAASPGDFIKVENFGED